MATPKKPGSTAQAQKSTVRAPTKKANTTSSAANNGGKSVRGGTTKGR